MAIHSEQLSVVGLPTQAYLTNFDGRGLGVYSPSLAPEQRPLLVPLMGATRCPVVDSE